MRAMISFRRALVEHHHAAYMSREGRLYYTLGSHGAGGGLAGVEILWRICLDVDLEISLKKTVGLCLLRAAAPAADPGNQT